jgi:hypothetical protein
MGGAYQLEVPQRAHTGLLVCDGILTWLVTKNGAATYRDLFPTPLPLWENVLDYAPRKEYACDSRQTCGTRK